MEQLSQDFAANQKIFDQLLGVGRNYDMVSRDFIIGGRRGRVWVLDGYGEDAVLGRVGGLLLNIKPERG